VAITTYSELRDAVARWLKRADAIALIPDFISLAEGRMQADLTTMRALWQRSQATLDAGSTFIATPDDLMTPISVALVKSSEIKRLPILAATSVRNDTTTTGEPSCCAFVGEQIVFSPPTTSAQTVELIYQRRIPALSDSVASNWLIEQSPNLYLYGALIESVSFTRDTEALAMWSQQYEAALERLRNVGWVGPQQLLSDIPHWGSTYDISRGY